MEIHQACIDDLEALVAMLEILFSQEAEFWPDPDAQRRGLALILESTSTGVIWVMRDETGIHGMLVMLFSVSTALGGRVGVLEDFVVLPTSRHRGLGRQLLAHAARTAKEMGLRRLTLLCDSDNADAMKLYRQSGWVRSPMVPMRLKIDSSQVNRVRKCQASQSEQNSLSDFKLPKGRASSFLQHRVL